MSDAEGVINGPLEWRAIHKAGPSPEPDARLLLLCRQWQGLERALERATDQLNEWELAPRNKSPTAAAINNSRSRSPASLEVAQDRLVDLQDKIAEQIAALPALTMSGLTAKLAIAAAAPIYANDWGLTESALEDSLRVPRSTLLDPLGAVSGPNPGSDT